MTWNHPALAARALTESDAEIRDLKKENAELRERLREMTDLAARLARDMVEK